MIKETINNEGEETERYIINNMFKERCNRSRPTNRRGINSGVKRILLQSGLVPSSIERGRRIIRGLV